MSYQLGSSYLRAILESAYRDYEIRTGMTLAAQPFVQQLEYYPSAKSMTSLLQGHIPTFCDSWRSHRMMGLIESIVYDICMLSTTVALGDAILQPPPGKAVLTGLATLLTVCVLLYFLVEHGCDIRIRKAAKGTSADYDALVDCLGLTKQFLKYLNVYTKIVPTPPMHEILVMIVVELLAILALATKEFILGQLSAPTLPDLLPYFMQYSRPHKEASRRARR